ncbi:unnamed protein product, partial [Meganyctiphanes norvegica]
MESSTESQDGSYIGSEEAMRAPVITILHFNDVYNVTEQPEESKVGAARFRTAMKDFADRDPLVIFSGDALSPSVMSTFTKGEQMVTVLNLLGIHCACYGNHEFDFGLERLENVNTATNFPWLLSNMVDEETQRPLGEAKEYHIIDWKGWKIGLIGLGEAQWLEAMATINPEEVSYYDYVDKANQLCPILREKGCDYIIAMTHLRQPNDERLMDNDPDIDLFLGGHDHGYEIIKINDKITLKSGTDFAEFSILTLTLEDSSVSVDIERIEVDSRFEPDAEVEEALSHYEEMLNANMEVILGCAAVELDGRESSVRMQETNLGNFICDVMMAATNSDLALLNAGTIRGDKIHKQGDFKVKDLMTILPMLTPLVVIEITGKNIVEALENGVSKYHEESGRFLQVAGVEFVFNPDAPVGSRVPSDLVMVADKYVNLDDKYRLTTTEYLRKGKDDFTMFPDCTILVDEEECPMLTCCVQNHFEAIKTCEGKSKKKTTHRQNLVLVSRRHTILQTDDRHPQWFPASEEPELANEKNAMDHWRTLDILKQSLSIFRINKEHVEELEQQACKLAPVVEGRIEKVSDEVIRKLRIQKRLASTFVEKEKEPEDEEKEEEDNV